MNDEVLLLGLFIKYNTNREVHLVGRVHVCVILGDMWIRPD